MHCAAHRYWYPLAYFLSLSFAPTALIGLDASLKPPVLPLVCAAKPSQFAYPQPVTQETSKEVAKVPQAVLSTTAKARERARKKAASRKEDEELHRKESGHPAATSNGAQPTAAADNAATRGEWPLCPHVAMHDGRMASAR